MLYETIGRINGGDLLAIYSRKYLQDFFQQKLKSNFMQLLILLHTHNLAQDCNGCQEKSVSLQLAPEYFSLKRKGFLRAVFDGNKS